MNSAIYEGRVRHRRHTPRGHTFEYGLYMLYLDLAELPTVFAGRWLWSTRRFALARFRRSDHLGDAGLPLDESVRRLVAERTGRRPTGPVRLLTQLSHFGYCFNPVSFYYCFDTADRNVETVVAEVTNTPWGETHAYVVDLAGERNAGGRSPRHRPSKTLHVSPFMPMDVEYGWNMSEPGQRLTVHMENSRNGEKLFDATLTLERSPITTGNLARVLVRYPLITVKVIAAIYWQALKLWIKRIPVYGHPANAAPAHEKKL